MNWEETIKYIRSKPEFKELVEFAYFEEQLPLNIERFKRSEEFSETKRLINTILPLGPEIKLLDVGSGNGISAVSFALEGIQVDSVEPDPSETIGAGAIKKLKQHYQLNNLNVYQGFAEELEFLPETYDIVYIRQCMHHAYDLQKFLNECSRVLKKGGLLITIRDHVIFDEKDKEWFLENHPLQKFYGGENAFTLKEYNSAIENSGFQIKLMLKHYDNVINYFPLKKSDKEKVEKQNTDFVESIVTKKLGKLSRIGFLKNIAEWYVKRKVGDYYDEGKVPGRMYSFLAIKK